MVVAHGYLAVSNAGVPVGVGCEDAAQCSNAHLVLEGSVLRHGAVQVPLNLLRSQRRHAQCLLHQLAIVARVGGQLVLGSWKKRVEGSQVRGERSSWCRVKEPRQTDRRTAATVLPGDAQGFR